MKPAHASPSLPALWDKRDLFNVLYGAPPQVHVRPEILDREQRSLRQSYRHTSPIVRDVATAEMTDHRFLTANRDMQETTYANGISVAVNFGTTPHILASGETVAPLGYLVRGRK